MYGAIGFESLLILFDYKVTYLWWHEMMTFASLESTCWCIIRLLRSKVDPWTLSVQRGANLEAFLVTCKFTEGQILLAKFIFLLVRFNLFFIKSDLFFVSWTLYLEITCHFSIFKGMRFMNRRLLVRKLRLCKTREFIIWRIYMRKIVFSVDKIYKTWGFFFDLLLILNRL